MSELNTSVAKLRNVAEQATKRFIAIKEDNEKLAFDVELLKEELDSRNKQIKELEKKIDIITLNNTITTKTDSKEAKKRINRLIHEIDKCITLLNQ